MTRYSPPTPAVEKTTAILAVVFLSLGWVAEARTQTIGSNRNAPSSNPTIPVGNSSSTQPVAAGPRADLRSLVMEYESARKANHQAYQSAVTPAAKAKAQSDLKSLVSIYAAKFCDYAQHNPTQAGVLDFLAWVIENDDGPAVDRSASLIAQYYSDRTELATVLGRLAAAKTTRPSVNLMLRGVARQSGLKLVQSHALFALARRLLNHDSAAAKQEASLALNRVIREFGDVPYATTANRTKLGDEAGKLLPKPTALATTRRPEDSPLPINTKRGPYTEVDLAVGKIAPEIAAYRLTGQPMRLSQFRGRITLLTFWGDW